MRYHPRKTCKKHSGLENWSSWVFGCPVMGGYFIGDWIKARTYHKITSILGGWRPCHPTFHPMKNPMKTPSQSHPITSLKSPSGKRLHSYGKSLFLMGKSTWNGHFNSYVYRRVVKQVVLNPADFHASKGPDRTAQRGGNLQRKSCGGRGSQGISAEKACWLMLKTHFPWRIHGAAIFANIKGVYWWDPWHTIYSSTMDPSWISPMFFESWAIAGENSWKP